MKSEIQAINCTACGATLDVLGGHRVQSLTCGYCGAVMDRHAGFQVLQRYRNHPERPTVPLSLGMQATLKGVPLTVIGMIDYASHQSGPGWSETYRWVSFQLYSPTHGYSWLTWNKGHYLFSYRTRELPNPVVPNGLLPKHTVTLDGRRFQMFERFVAEIAYVEGELTWIATRGEKVRVVEAINPPFMFSYERSADELEYSIGEYMEPDAVHAAFGIDPPPRPEGMHPAQPFDPGPILPALAKVGPIFAGIALLMLIFVVIVGGGRELMRSSIDAPASHAGALPFKVTDAERLHKIELSTPVSNDWVYYDVTVTDAKSDQEVLSLGQEISFYEGRDSDGYWTEGSRQAEALFKLPASGDYELAIQASEASGAVPPLEIRLYDQVFVKRYVALLLVLSVLAGMALPVYRHRTEKKRWAEVLDDDDD